MTLRRLRVAELVSPSGLPEAYNCILHHLFILHHLADYLRLIFHHLVCLHADITSCGYLTEGGMMSPDCLAEA